MMHATIARWVMLASFALPLVARAACPPSCAIPGGSNPALDCQAEFAGTGLRLNYPSFDPAHPKPGKEVRCFDGDAGCDLDDAAEPRVRLRRRRLSAQRDPALPGCMPADVTRVSVSGTRATPSWPRFRARSPASSRRPRTSAPAAARSPCR